MDVDEVDKVVETPHKDVFMLRRIGNFEWNWDELCFTISRVVFNMADNIPDPHWITIPNGDPGQKPRLEDYKVWKKTIWENRQYEAKNGQIDPAATSTQRSFDSDVDLACMGKKCFSTVSGLNWLGASRNAAGDRVFIPFQEVH